jgi:hypothetical protein
MSGSQLVPPAMTKLPAAIRKFWGPPPILPSESAESYWTFAAAIVRSIGPLDAILWLLVKDVVDYSWEIRELRRHGSRFVSGATAPCCRQPGRMRRMSGPSFKRLRSVSSAS